MTAALAPARLHFLLDHQLEITPTVALPDGSCCTVCDEGPALIRVYGTDKPCWTVNTPFEYAEACLDCGAVCVAVAVRQRAADAGPIRVEVAADVWACRDDEGC